ncbi:MAG TPA: hypothetical protein DDW94_01605 [Deltaproteobacteria bacterium]|nr:MAG: hypothetical protein A2Z79_07785 [Deltaproteobacteria bacterium GWA2_55_82]OGQ65129.1 MAG: hypothetical protein A3I81_07205 [Deltaproteobacteria bacterium RIFCSPLOWO2_02_FULL_55_12]OIJ74744.1 MAG: hypothetical protein A2V21_311000 [Deltaproteobacteria bacterium GWC2_55_46]HBG45669.1 hypothetical protein [Deltaproteobacteria bacterium]HCY12138.1 hypothetical protein [Deltaproteobacteria bacterium]
MLKAYCAIFFLIASLSASYDANAATLYVPERHRTIQDAVNAATPFDVIVINSGIYIENVTIEKPLILRSNQGAASTMVQAAIQNKPALKVSGTSDVSITGLSATGSTVAGVFVFNSKNVVLSKNSLTNNGIGIFLQGVSYSSVTGNDSSSNSQYGLYMEKSQHNRVEFNSATLNKDKGFFISYSDNNEIVNNSVNLNSWDGIMVFASNGNTLTGNRTLRNTYGIVISESNGNEVAENTTIPNLFIILPIALIYLGIVSYLLQKNLLKIFYKE